MELSTHESTPVDDFNTIIGSNLTAQAGDVDPAQFIIGTNLHHWIKEDVFGCRLMYRTILGQVEVRCEVPAHNANERVLLEAAVFILFKGSNETETT